MNTTALKTQIITATALASTLRREATRQKTKARSLFQESEQATGTPKAKTLGARANIARDMSRSLRTHSDKDRHERRHLHLAAALLNNKTYKACEPRIDPTRTSTADAEYIALLVKPCLRKEYQDQAEHISTTWLEMGTATLKDIRAGSLDKAIRLRDLEKKIQDKKTALNRAQMLEAQHERSITDTKTRLRIQEIALSKAVKEQEVIQKSLNDLLDEQKQLQGKAEPLPEKTEAREIRTIDDLFEAA